ncbi:phage major capsid protein [Curtobacterium sp. MCJR17_020]|uniref:phage major capsid protein n=1 Tax=Curtobacterium sp. MCJR17_020 TaxID=2175619 RepID=UPI0011B7C989|nr:phage major capsid protein [Curtobacterium sp. MCJR17_020]WIE70800.1 phage major capsid protein [Curtobacterium sp. MCJR17_020]
MFYTKEFTTMNGPKQELTLIKSRLASLIADVTSTGRDLSAAETAELEKGNARVVEIKAAIERGEKNAAVMAGFHTGGTGETIDIDGNVIGVKSASGFITPASVKATAQRMVGAGIKALVAGGSATQPVALDTKPIPKGEAGLGLLSLLEVRVRDTRNYSHLTQTVRTHNAAVVAPGAEKPVSTYTVAEVQNHLDVVATLSEMVDKFLLSDSADLEAFLTNELRNGVLRKVTSLAVAKILATSGVQSQAYSGSAADSLFLGKSKIESLGYQASAIVIDQATYDSVRLSKDANGQYLGGNAFMGGENYGLWGVPTLASPDVPAGKALVIGQGAANISTDKEGIQVAWDAITGFSTNQVRARVEGRFATDVTIPEAITVVNTAAA